MFDDVFPEPGRPWSERWFAPATESPTYVRARFIWLRCLGAIFFSAFLSLWFQIHGLIGPNGLLPASEYLKTLRDVLGVKAYWLAPTLLWFSAGDRALTVLVVAGLVASVALIFNVFPRVAIAIAFVCFLSFVAAAQEFSGYQSDGMLLEAALLSFFLASRKPPTRAAVFMLQWEWFRIYFESGVVKILSGEEQWRNLTAMDKYYENGPLPTFLGWYVQQWPHSFHAASAAATLIVELIVVWLLFLPKKARLIAFCIVTPLQIGIILTANYAFLNYLVLCLGVFLLADRTPAVTDDRRVRLAQVVVLPTLFVTTIASFMLPIFPTVRLLDPFRVANSYGLFAVMTRARYEIEFQGTTDGVRWTPYPFTHKPQDLMTRPGIYAPYQPRFDWNLWFASLGSWENNRWILNAEVRLLQNDQTTLSLFTGNPFAKTPLIAVRSVLWQYWFTTTAERARTHAWWRREFLGQYAPVARRQADGSIALE
jgi:uncharacterized membrane protein YphA (DoxX/SURF4 family)